MRIIEDVAIEVIEAHLKKLNGAVSLDLLSRRPERGVRIRLDSEDLEKIVLWWEFQKDTKALSCRLTDLLASAACRERVQRFMEGDPHHNYSPVDLRLVPDLEPVFLTDNLEGSFFYLIDGNHRSMAQHLVHQDFTGVSAYACVCENLSSWANIPEYYKRGGSQ